MNTLKTVVVTVVLMAVGYGVYVSIWQKPDPNAPEKTTDASAGPIVQMSEQGSSGTQTPTASLNGGTRSTTPSPGTLGAQAPLFGSNSRNGNSGNPAGLSNGGFSPNSVTLIPGPNAGTPPADPSIAAPGMAPVGNPPAGAFPGGTTSSPGSPAPQDEFRESYLSFMRDVEKLLDDGKLPEALQTLTAVYEKPNLPEPQKREIEQLLDQLAGTVIYSRQSYIYPAYTVQPGDTLDQIAERCNVPAALLARINGIEPQQLQPGQSLKILRGPFTADIDLARHELTLRLEGGYYAGRFPIGVGTDCPKLEGSYTVQEKTAGPSYHGPDGQFVAPNDGRNPLGKYLIGLGNRIGLHGTIDETSIGRDDARGNICLKDRDIDDLFGILSVGSKVVIRR